ncbi:hypothetical protein Cgig2_033949 [Carnegiea gigantea]|uniref:Uncharacterized protein n=1 Tax=Carnegiea gigantea TaxID=171969 RepID=A0A9Q1QI62_9CARY|nr:hypothetical protein Cgig2_033949 [Carnegiea gigantea]
MYDLRIVDGKAGLVAGGEELDKDYNRWWLSAQIRYVILRYKMHGTHQCITTLELYTWFDVRNLPIVGSASVLCNMANCPLATKNVDLPYVIISDSNIYHHHYEALVTAIPNRNANVATGVVRNAWWDAHMRPSMENMAGPSRRRAYSHGSTRSRTTRTYFETREKYHCYYQLEVAVLEMDDNYRRRFVACPWENENACQFLNMIDPNYPKQARDVIDELVEEVRQESYLQWTHDLRAVKRAISTWMFTTGISVAMFVSLMLRMVA